MDTLYSSFTIEFKKKLFQSKDLIGRSCRARTPIRVFVGDVCITAQDERFRVGDFVPYNCTKMLQAIEDIVNCKPHTVRYTDSVCDINFHPIDEDIVYVNAYESNNESRNPDVPRKGLPVLKQPVFEEIVHVSEHIENEFREFDCAKDDPYFSEFTQALDSAKQVIRN